MYIDGYIVFLWCCCSNAYSVKVASLFVMLLRSHLAEQVLAMDKSIVAGTHPYA